MHNWSQQYRIVYEKYCDVMLALGADKRDVTEKSMKAFLGVSSGKGDAWKRGQWPSAEDMATIAIKLGFSYRWLVTGEGDPFGEDAPMPQHTERENAPPVDEELLKKVIEMLEQALNRAGSVLPPDAKAEAISQLYMMVLEDEGAAQRSLVILEKTLGSIAAEG